MPPILATELLAVFLGFSKVHRPRVCIDFIEKRILLRTLKVKPTGGTLTTIEMGCKIKVKYKT